jgi:ATPase subunit of ABC transporter with duplicated ATPase domains
MTLAVAQLSAREVLTDVSFTARPSEILGVIGPNGAGKTTLFECVAGLLPFDSGKVENDVLFYVPDAIRPWPDQTVRWTLELTSHIRLPPSRRRYSRRAASATTRAAPCHENDDWPECGFHFQPHLTRNFGDHRTHDQPHSAIRRRTDRPL